MNYSDPEKTRMRQMRAAHKESRQEPVNTVACLNAILKQLLVNGYSQDFLGKTSKEIEYVCRKFSITPIQSVLLAVIAEEASGGRTAEYEDIAQSFDVTNLELMSYIKEVQEMSRKHIIRILVNPHRNDCNYDVYGDAMEAILNDSEYSAPSNANLDTEEIFSRMRKLFSEYYEYALPVNRLYEELTDLVQNSPDSLFCQKIKEIEFDDAHYMVIFLYLCHRYASHGVGSMEVGRLLKLLDPKKDSKRIEREIMNEYTSLHYFGLVEFSSEDGLADTSKLSLTENVRKEFFTELDIRNEDAGVRNPDIKSHESIVGKRLFFNAAEREQMERLSSLLRDENFKEVQGRLAEQGLRKGVNILLYGPPGTGKTESCLQLARETGRDIFIVDVSKLRSKWHGDSEKNVSNVFRTYHDLVRRGEKAPILLLNEADAILGIRMANPENSCDKSNNSIQNIILQNMETLDGILIATTNLEASLDPAFERRFLFKIRLSVPDEDTRSEIWKEMLPELPADDARILAREYPLSGGQTENVCRKAAISYIIEGKKVGMTELTKYCEEETIGEKPVGKRRIGFEYPGR